jgi:Flp pilus assembly protein TadG
MVAKCTPAMPTRALRCRRGIHRRLWPARDGATAIETAILLPVFLTMLFGICEFGRALWTQAALQYAVEAAARCRALNVSSCATSTSTQTYAAGQAFALQIPSSEFTVSSPSCGTQVSVSHAFDPIVPQLVPLSVTLTAQSCHP